MTEVLSALEQPHTQLLLRLIVGGLLLLAGVTKLVDRNGFRDAVAEYKILPAALERPFTLAAPLLETALGILLLLGLGTAFAAALATPLFLSFGLAIGVNLARGRDFNCHCFGAVQSEQIGWPALVRSLALAFAALTVALGASRFGAVESALFGTGGVELPPVSEVIPIVLLAFVLFDALLLLPEAIATQLSFRRAYGSRAASRNNHHTPAAIDTEAVA